MNFPKKLFIPIFILFGLFTNSVKAQDKPSGTKYERNIYAKGVQAPATNFTGIVWVNMLVTPQDQLDGSIGSVTFEPGARSNWHSHAGGQVLLVTEGKGLYQEKGSPVRMIKKGEVIVCPPNKEHWHGATPKKKLTHIAIGPDAEKGPAVWFGEVTDEEYNNFK